jgi:two-component system, NtrC family, response regulator AtoC
VITPSTNAVVRGTVLVVDDEDTVRASLRAILKSTTDVLEASNGREALETLRAQSVDVVLLDQRLPGAQGLDVLSQIKALDPTIIVVLATAVRDVRIVVEALKRGAYDFITKPFDADDTALLVQRALEKRALEREVLCRRAEHAVPGPDDGDAFPGIIGRHPQMIRIQEVIRQVASTPTTTVLITGESGTGKELVARAVHHHSPRSAKPFVAFNVAAFPDTLIDAELFGYEKGAFTGANARKLGRFELAQGGTVFLDEIGSLRLDLQAKLLRVLQQREVDRLGGARPIPVDVRVLAATNTDLRAAVKAGTFREDLYYRLNVVRISVPPLRERRADIPLLVDYFVQKIARECSRNVNGVSIAARELLSKYDWPGNIRELENILHRAVVLATGPILQLHDFPMDVAIPEAGPRLSEGINLPLKEATEEFERQYVLRVLDQVNWNVTAASRILGVHRNTIITRLSAWGLHRPAGDEGQSGQAAS